MSAGSDRRRRYDERQAAYFAEREAEQLAEIEANAEEAGLAACIEPYRSMAELIGEPAAAAVLDFVLAITRGEHKV